LSRAHFEDFADVILLVALAKPSPTLVCGGRAWVCGMVAIGPRRTRPRL
jgi:hypothetical protein